MYVFVFYSPSYDLPVPDDKTKKFQTFICHNCGETGHKSYQCPKLQAPSVVQTVTPATNSSTSADVKVCPNLSARAHYNKPYQIILTHFNSICKILSHCPRLCTKILCTHTIEPGGLIKQGIVPSLARHYITTIELKWQQQSNIHHCPY